METNKKLTVGVIALAAFTLSSSLSSAAEPGAFFVKGTGGYNIANTKMKLKTDEKSASVTVKSLGGALGGISFGYVATEDVWSDITIGFNRLQTKKNEKSLKDVASKVSHDGISAMFNGYYGFNTGSKVVPYVMGGVGAGRTKTKITALDNGIKVKDMILNDKNGAAVKGTIVSKNSTALAYQGGFGVTLEMMKGVAFDVGYTIGNQTEGKFKNVNKLKNNNMTFKVTTPMKHSITGGVRVVF